jgi:hypothetical protein
MPQAPWLIPIVQLLPPRLHPAQVGFPHVPPPPAAARQRVHGAQAAPN